MPERSAPALKPIVTALLHAFWRDARVTLAVAAGASLIGAGAGILGPVLFSHAVDALTAASGNPYALLAVCAIVSGLSNAVTQTARHLVHLCSEQLCFIADSAFFSRLLAKPSAFFLEHNPIQIGSARSEGRYALAIVLQFVVSGVLPGAVQIGVSLALLGGLVSLEIAVIVLVYGMVVILLDYLRVARVNPFLDGAIERSQEGSALVGNAVTMVETLRHTRSQAWMTERFRDSAKTVLAQWRQYSLHTSLFSAAGGAAIAVQLIVTFFLLVPRYESGSITLGDLVLFNTLLLQLNEPFHVVGEAIKEISDAVGRFRPFAAIWAAPEDEEPKDAMPFRASAGAILFEKISFHYANGRGVDDLSFVVRPDTPAFLIGETGSGKSTVLRLLLKDIRPDSGRILVDGVDLADISRNDWFAEIGVVPQDIALFNEDLATNIVLGRPFDAQRLRQAAARAAILNRIEALPDGFATKVGERGMKLSGGERQRIAIARALYSDPRILILDEASSALDAETEADIMDGLRALSGRLTILSVTHRKSIIRPGDQVFDLSR